MNHLNIAIDALSARSGGGVTYLSNLIKALHDIGGKDRYLVFVTEGYADEVVTFESDRIKIISIASHRIASRILYEQLIMPILLIRFKIDVLFAPAEVAPILSKIPMLLGIQNLNVYESSEVSWPLYHKLRFFGLRILARLSAAKAGRVIFLSEYSRSIISPTLRVPNHKTQVVGHGVDRETFFNHKTKTLGTPPSFSDVENPLKLVNGRHYILCVSDVDLHKNQAVLINAYARLSMELRRKHQLLIVGRLIDPYHEYLRNLVDRLNLGEYVALVGEYPHEDMPLIYSHATVSVFPSLVETFGLPIIESMACGVPVVAADNSAIPEVVGDAGVLFNPEDSDDLAMVLEDILTKEDYRRNLLEKGLKRADQFSWNGAAEAIHQCLLDVAEVRD